MTDIVAELRQDLARDRYKEIWDKYGNKLALIIAAVIFMLLAYVFYTQQQTNNIHKASTLYENYLNSLAQGDIVKAQSLYQQIHEIDEGKIYSLLASLKADKRISLADTKFNRSSNYAYYRELLQLKNFNGSKEITSDNWQYLAKEQNLLRAFYAIENGNAKAAREAFSMILIDSKASPEYQKLAMEFINYLDEREIN